MEGHLPKLSSVHLYWVFRRRGDVLVRDRDHSIEPELACELEIRVNLARIQGIGPSLHFDDGSPTPVAASHGHDAVRPNGLPIEPEGHLNEGLNLPCGSAKRLEQR